MRVNYLQKRDIEFIVLTSDCGLEVILANLGASIFSIKYKREMMTMTPIMVEDFEKINIYYGKTIGRVAGRVKDSKIEVEGKTYNLEPSEGTNSLHGGKYSIHTKYFESSVKEFEDKVEVTYSYLSKDLENGYPGNVNYKVIYTILNSEPVIKINFEITTDKTCPISPTNHCYFCVGEKSLHDCELRISADRYVEVDPVTRISKSIEKIKPCLDFNYWKYIMRDFKDSYLQDNATKGYDHLLLFSSNHDQISLRGSRFELDIDTDMEGTQIYSHNYSDNVISINSGALQYRALAIEPQLNPLNSNLLHPGEVLRKYIKYTFKEIN